MSSDLLTRARLVFWDFDGVVKESVGVKTEAFMALFAPFGEDVAARVRAHHLANGGMSRLEKMPVYLEWAGQPVTAATIDACCRQFSELVLRSVVAAPWVPGVNQYLRNNRHGQQFVMVSATPQQEIEETLIAIDLDHCFSDVFGAPTRKDNAIRRVLFSQGLPDSACLMVGDATADLDAARRNGVPFLLRRHPDNHHVFRDYDGAFVEDFSGL